MNVDLNKKDIELRDRIRLRRKKKRKLVVNCTIIAMVCSAAAIAIFITSNAVKRKNESEARKKSELEAKITAEENELNARREAIEKAEEMISGYYYDEAIAMLEAIPGHDTDTEIIDEIAKINSIKTTLEPVDITTVPHIFYHSLIVDTDRAFDESVWSADEVAGINAWMTTVSEFDKITQEMYDNGYVLVRMRDLVKETKNADGTVTLVPNDELKLPPGKHPYVLSIDDWSYYHSYSGKGYAEKAVLDENGKVKCLYTDADGVTDIGDYDVVPRLNTFMESHPDASYKGARGMIALTGYNGVFGYRTDVAYKTGEKLSKDQKEWLDAHPDFDWEEDVAEATKIADAVKESGWEFACHTWGHLSVTGLSVQTLSEDQQKWQNTVANITGKTDIIIFAHGNDICDWHPYNAETNEVFAYFKGMGYNYYCNVDASAKSWVQQTSDYLRQGRIDCDGIQMYRALSGQAKVNVFEDMFNVNDVFDPARPTPVTASGKA
ncbi:MAG: polysaccharide deacetylase family protein [Lachnospiraceae bacterium]|jgi:hypothetical protein